MRRTSLSRNFITSHIASMCAAMESVDFQQTTFFKELTLIFTELKSMKQSEVAEGKDAARIGKIIKHHTGLNVTINFGDFDPSVEIPMVNKNNVLINSFIRNYLNSSDGLKMIVEAKGAARGTVNLKTGKVTGVFADVQSTINLPIYMLIQPKMSAEELAAITMHEIGHLIVYYEFMCRSVTTNQALAGLAKALDGSGNVQEREAVLMSVKDVMNLGDLDVKSLAKSNNAITEVVMITNIAKHAESELGSNIYDFSTWEYLADQYAARQGAGRHIVTALDKLYRGNANISFRSLPSYLAMEAFKAFSLIAPVVGAFGGNGGIQVGIGLFKLATMLIAMDGAGDGTYDRPGARFKRVRNQIVENLKDRKLPKDTQERLQADLVAIDAVLSHVVDRRQMLGVVWDTISPSARRNWNQLKLQRDLEDIAANDLFTQSSKLATMA